MKHMYCTIAIFVFAVMMLGVLPGASAQTSGTPEASIEKAFRQAKQNYLDKKMDAAARQINEGAAFMKSESMKASGQGKAALAASAHELEELATNVRKGAVTSVKKIEDAFARAYLALAKESHANSSRSWAEKQAQKAGDGLEKAGAYLEKSFTWAGYKVEAETTKALQKSRELSQKLKEKGRVIAEEVGKGLKETGNEIEKFGKKISPK